MKQNVIELVVQNHPGVMSHITGLFSRRAFNLEGILVGRIGDGEKSRIFLLVNEDERLHQIEKQIKKLYDVISLQIREDIDPAVFTFMSEAMEQGGVALQMEGAL